MMSDVRKKRKGSRCAALNCKTYYYDEGAPSFFRFPRDEERCLKWVINGRMSRLMAGCVLKVPAEKLNMSLVLCAKHFEQSQFVNNHCKRLNWNAVPTIFDVPNPPPRLEISTIALLKHTAPTRVHLPHQPSSSHSHCSAHTQKCVKLQYPIVMTNSHCWAPNCPSKHYKSPKVKAMIKYFKFPTNHERRVLWSLKCGKLAEPPLHARLCQFHFDHRCFERCIPENKWKLMSTAVPTIFFHQGVAMENTYAKAKITLNPATLFNPKASASKLDVMSQQRECSVKLQKIPDELCNSSLEEVTTYLQKHSVSASNSKPPAKVHKPTASVSAGNSKPPAKVHKPTASVPSSVVETNTSTSQSVEQPTTSETSTSVSNRTSTSLLPKPVPSIGKEPFSTSPSNQNMRSLLPKPSSSDKSGTKLLIINSGSASKLRPTGATESGNTSVPGKDAPVTKVALIKKLQLSEAAKKQNDSTSKHDKVTVVYIYVKRSTRFTPVVVSFLNVPNAENKVLAPHVRFCIVNENEPKPGTVALFKVHTTQSRASLDHSYVYPPSRKRPRSSQDDAEIVNSRRATQLDTSSTNQQPTKPISLLNSTEDSTNENSAEPEANAEMSTVISGQQSSTFPYPIKNTNPYQLLLARLKEAETKAENYYHRWKQEQRQAKTYKTKFSTLQTHVSKVLDTDQIEVMSRRSSQGGKWNQATLKKAMILWFAFGQRRYKMITDVLQLPMPAIRSVQRCLFSASSEFVDSVYSKMREYKIKSIVTRENEEPTDFSVEEPDVAIETVEESTCSEPFPPPAGLTNATGETDAGSVKPSTTDKPTSQTAGPSELQNTKPIEEAESTSAVEVTSLKKKKHKRDFNIGTPLRRKLIKTENGFRIQLVKAKVKKKKRTVKKPNSAKIKKENVTKSGTVKQTHQNVTKSDTAKQTHQNVTKSDTAKQPCLSKRKSSAKTDLSSKNKIAKTVTIGETSGLSTFDSGRGFASYTITTNQVSQVSTDPSSNYIDNVVQTIDVSTVPNSSPHDVVTIDAATQNEVDNSVLALLPLK